MKKLNLIFIAILLFALTLKTITLLNWHGLTFDEMVSADLAQKSLTEVLYYSQWETHPPLYYLVLDMWGHIFGQFERSWRALSLLISMSSLVAIYFLAKELFGKRVGLIAMFLFSISVFFNFYGLWLRMYSLAILLSILSFYFFLKIINNENKKKIWITLYVIVTAVNLYTHLFSLFVLLAQASYVAILKLRRSINREKTIQLLICIGINILIFLPWLIFGFLRKLSAINPDAWYFSDQSGELLGLYAIVSRLFILTDNTTVAQLGLAALLVIFLAALFIVKKERNNWNVALDSGNSNIFVWLIFVITFFFIITTGMFRLRFYFLPAIGLILLAAYSLNKIKEIKFLFLVIIFISALSISGLYGLARGLETGWAVVGTFIESNEEMGDIVLLAHPNHALPLKFYYHKDMQPIVIGDQEIYRQDLTKAILQNNIYSGARSDELEILKNLTKNKKRIFLVYSGSGFKTDQDRIKDRLVGDGWQITKKYENDNFDKPGVMVLSK
jgi:uncharacterized membrane protein